MPFGVGMASDPMAFRRGAKKLPMEDVCYYHWPLPGTDQVLDLLTLDCNENVLHFFGKTKQPNPPVLQFGVFGICDGHGGVAAANSASK